MKSSRGWIALALLLFGCSENIGPPPPDGATRRALRSEAATGPTTPRTGTAIVARGATVWWGTDAGLYRLDPDRSAVAGLALHAGFFTGDGGESVGIVQRLAVGAAGARVVFAGRRTAAATLGTSADGGASFVEIARPDPGDFEVDAVGVASPASAWPAGAWLVAQGPRIGVREVGADVWTRHDVPGSVRRIDAFASDAAGRILVAAITPSDSTVVWRFSGIDAAWERVGGSTGDAVLALAAVADDAVWVGPTGVHRPDATLVTWTDRTIVRGALAVAADAIRWALAAPADRPGASRLARGTGDAVLPGDAGTVVTPGIEGLALDEDGVWWVDETAALGRAGQAVERIDFPGTLLGASAVGVLDADAGTIAVARRLDGEVFVGPADDPNDFVSRGARSNDTIRALLADPGDRTTLLAASFGVYASSGPGATWTGRNIGFVPYDESLGDRINVVALDALADGDLWCGGENGEGPYRWNPATLRWDRPHAGLGAPRTSAFGALEPGLPFVTQVRGFARADDGAVWMAGFRGGVWERDATADRWRGRNRGLPDLAGAPMDTCCVVAPSRQVDARAIVRVAGGTLLAATGWGVFARSPDADRWEDRSLGLTNRDVRALAVHPRVRDTVVAVARGRPGVLDWMFVSEDAGRTWFPVATSRLAVPATDVVWSRPDRDEIVVRIEGRGVWRMELEP